ncbi:MAG TPA: enoyl-CoA hydratase/isomerase family protein [Terriglobales bacterium]|nr:enoyl-CoA hydratase/isomerase family protein [Terriglobales bacterium]
MQITNCQLQICASVRILQLCSSDGTNRLTRTCILELTSTARNLARDGQPLIITGNDRFFSAGAELHEIAALTGPEALEFSRHGQELMNLIAAFPAPVCAAIRGYGMGGGLDLALACHYRVAAPHAMFGHRGAALGLITGWGGTQRLPRLIGKARALQMFVAAEKVNAEEALRIGLVHAVAEEPVTWAVGKLKQLVSNT